MKRLFTGAAAAALSLTIAGSANAAVFAFNSNPGGMNYSGTDTYSLTIAGLTVSVKGFGSLGTSVNLGDQDDVEWSSNGLGVDGGNNDNDDELDTDDGQGEGLLLDFGQVVNLTQAQFSAWSSGDDADYRFSNGLPSGSLDDISGLSVSNSVATWNTNLTGRYFFFAAIDEGSRYQRDSDKFWLKNVTASAIPTTPPGGGAVPEPATWAMMILGFGLAGSQIRRAVREQKRAVAH